MEKHGDKKDGTIPGRLFRLRPTNMHVVITTIHHWDSCGTSIWYDSFIPRSMDVTAEREKNMETGATTVVEGSCEIWGNSKGRPQAHSENQEIITTHFLNGCILISQMGHATEMKRWRQDSSRAPAGQRLARPPTEPAARITVISHWLYWKRLCQIDAWQLEWDMESVKRSKYQPLISCATQATVQRFPVPVIWLQKCATWRATVTPDRQTQRRQHSQRATAKPWAERHHKEALGLGNQTSA